MEWSGPYPQPEGYLFTKPANPRFWQEWQSNKKWMKQNGFSPSKDERGNWFINWLRPWPYPSLHEPLDLPCPLSRKPPSMAINAQGLLPYQADPVASLCAILSKEQFAVDLSDTGVGKTVMALTVARELSLKPFIVCPKAVIPSWKRWAKHVGVEPELVINYEKLRTGKTKWARKTGRKQPGHTTYEWNHLTKDHLVIMDEAHVAKNKASATGQMVAALKAGKAKGLALSATMAESPLDMKNIGYLLDLHKYTDFYKWAAKLGCKRGKYNSWEFCGSQSDIQTLRSLILPHKGIRVTRQEAAEHFTHSQIIAETYDIGDDETIWMQQAYERMQNEIDEARTLLSRAEAQKSARVALLRARQEAELLKVPVLAQMALDHVLEGCSVAIFTNFRETVEQLNKLLPRAAIVQGGQDPEERERSIQGFQSGAKDIIILNLQSGGTGIDLHDTTGGRQRVSLICPTFDARLLKQALGRIDRSGAKSDTIQKIVYAAGSEIEERCCDVVRAKCDNIDLLNDGELIAHVAGGFFAGN